MRKKGGCLRAAVSGFAVQASCSKDGTQESQKQRNTWLHTRVVVVLDLTVRGRFAEFRM